MSMVVIATLAASSWTLPPPAGRCSLISWNLLAPQFAEPSKYSWSDPADLAWPARQSKIVKHLADADADVVCLQEVEVDRWPALLARLERLGYAGELQQMARNHPVANAVLVRRGALQIVRTESRSRVFLAVLRDAAVKCAPPLYLANCHLEAGATEKAAATRLFQLRSMLRRVELQRVIDVADSVCRPNVLSLGTGAADAALVLAGDFNFDRSSELYSFLSQGTLRATTGTSAAAGAATGAIAGMVAGMVVVKEKTLPKVEKAPGEAAAAGVSRLARVVVVVVVAAAYQKEQETPSTVSLSLSTRRATTASSRPSRSRRNTTGLIAFSMAS